LWKKVARKGLSNPNEGKIAIKRAFLWGGMPIVQGKRPTEYGD